MNQIQDAPIRSQIHADMTTVWTGTRTPKKQHDDVPLLPKSPDDLPYSIVALDVVKQEKSGLKKVYQHLVFTLTYFGSWPSSGILLDEKRAVANLLIMQLTASSVYSIGYDPIINSITFADDVTKNTQTQNNEPYFTVEIEFEVTVVESR